MGIDGAEIKLTLCPGCDKPVSKSAETCPQCGHPLKSPGRSTESYDNSFICGISGTIALAIGVFCPIISAPFVGNINFFANGKDDGVALLIFAGLSLVLLFINKTKLLIYTGISSLAILGYTFYRFRSKLNEMSAKLDSGMGGNGFGGLADMAANSIQMQWGWPLLVLAAALLITAGVLEHQKQ